MQQDFNQHPPTLAGDMWKRVVDLEHEASTNKNEIRSLRESHNAIAKDLKDTSSALRQMTTDLSVLVTNVGHLTDAVTKLHQVVDRTQQMELDIVYMKTRTQTIERLWDSVDTIRTEIDTSKQRASVHNVVIRAVQVVGASAALAVIGIVITKILGS